MRIYKMIWGFFCACCLLAVNILTVSAEQRESEKDISLYATAAVLIDADSGRVLYGKNADTSMAMASTTKIMTCILVLENVSLDEELTVSAYAASMPKVKLSVRKGERYSVRDLLYSLMLESHNDSAVALAEHVGRKFLPEELRLKEASDYSAEESRQAVAAFALLMNRKAQELGCENTWFITPNGLDATETIVLDGRDTLQKDHCTTATELARIMAYCIRGSDRSEEFLEITRTRNYSFYANERSYSCVNHNAFLDMMEGALTGKTGFTNKAGYCYVGALEREGRTFVVALLACGWPNNKSYKWSDTRELMQYGIENYFYKSFSEKGTAFEESRLKAIPVINGQTDILGETLYMEVRIAGRDDPAQSVGSGAGRIARNSRGSSESAASGTGNSTGDESEVQGAGKDEGNSGTVTGTGNDGKWVEGVLLREDEKIQVKYCMKETLTAPVERGALVGWIDYIVDGIVYKREGIVTASAAREIDPEWCVSQIFERFLLFGFR